MFQMLLHETLIKKWTQAREVECGGTGCGEQDMALEPVTQRWGPLDVADELPEAASCHGTCHCIPGRFMGPVVAVLRPVRVNAVFSHQQWKWTAGLFLLQW